MEPGGPVITGGAYDNVVLDLAQLLGKTALECEEEGVTTVVGRRTSGCLDEVDGNKGGVITDGDKRWQNRLSTDFLFVATAFCSFGDGIVDLLFV